MKVKRLLLITLLFVVTIFAGCTKLNEKQQKIDVFMPKNIDFYNIYTINDKNQEILVYFPVVTNKAIVKTENQSVSSVINMQSDIDGDLTKVALKVLPQDKLNNYYNGFYISFLKFQVVISNIDDGVKYINLWDTTIKIYFKSGCDFIKYEDVYLRIDIDYLKEPSIPDWERVTAEMESAIKDSLK